ncbi:MAG: hypothetical protein LW724_14670, partial [Planctomycetaceae bacterium]|nr:hypothetical protein [Planctomycetaceae bacterium]
MTFSMAVRFQTNQDYQSKREKSLQSPIWQCEAIHQKRQPRSRHHCPGETIGYKKITSSLYS